MLNGEQLGLWPAKQSVPGSQVLTHPSNGSICRFCSMNPDPNRNRCDLPEEVSSGTVCQQQGNRVSSSRQAY